MSGLMNGMAGWAWVFGALMILGLGLLTVVLVRALTTGIERRAHPEDVAPHSVSARDILAERYARGEIDTAEFQERLRRLREG